jgi:hypothetical protein
VFEPISYEKCVQKCCLNLSTLDSGKVARAYIGVGVHVQHQEC